MASPNKLSIELGDWSDEVFDAVLIGQRQSLAEDLRRRESGETSFGMIHSNKEKDIKAMRKLLKAFDRIMAYNGVEQ